MDDIMGRKARFSKSATKYSLVRASDNVDDDNDVARLRRHTTTTLGIVIQTYAHYATETRAKSDGGDGGSIL